MNAILKNYFDFMTSPFQYSREGRALKVEEIVGLSWIFQMLNGLYGIFSIYLGIKSFELLSGSDEFSNYLVSVVPREFGSLSVFNILFYIVYFPFQIFIFIKIWTFFINLYTKLFNLEVESKDIEHSVSHSFCSFGFLCIPVFGFLFQFVSQFIYLYSGFTQRLGMNKQQAIITIISPIVLISMFIVTIVIAYASLLISIFI